MPINSTTFNSRITSEALESKFRQVFPAQGGAELVQDLYASGVIQPVIDFSSIAEGSGLPEYLQTAWDFSTGSNVVTGTGWTNLITNTGFWEVDLIHTGFEVYTSAVTAQIVIFDNATRKPVWGRTAIVGAGQGVNTAIESKFVVFLRSGDILQAKCMTASADKLDVWYRQVADVYGNLRNPQGFTFS